ncbi:hypothetical protein LINPERPRIM_LOCUS15156 [Linum perenne]
MKIEIVGSNIATPVVPLVNGNFGNLNGPCGRGRGYKSFCSPDVSSFIC